MQHGQLTALPEDTYCVSQTATVLALALKHLATDLSGRTP